MNLHVAIDPDNVAFEGFSLDSLNHPVKGIYTNAGGTLAKVIATRDMIGGSAVTDVSMGPGGFSARLSRYLPVPEATNKIPSQKGDSISVRHFTESRMLNDAA